GRAAIGLDRALDVPVLHLLGESAMERLVQARWPHGPEPVPIVPADLPADMGDLAHQRRAVAVYARREILEMRNDGVVAEIELAHIAGRIDGDRGRAAEDGQADAALGLFFM